MQVQVHACMGLLALHKLRALHFVVSKHARVKWQCKYGTCLKLGELVGARGGAIRSG